MKKKNITLSKKLFLGKETIVELNQDMKDQVVGGALMQKTPVGVSGTGCGCAVQTCGIVVCSYAGGCEPILAI